MIFGLNQSSILSNSKSQILLSVIINLAVKVFPFFMSVVYPFFNLRDLAVKLQSTLKKEVDSVIVMFLSIDSTIAEPNPH